MTVLQTGQHSPLPIWCHPAWSISRIILREDLSFSVSPEGSVIV